MFNSLKKLFSRKPSIKSLIDGAVNEAILAHQLSQEERSREIKLFELQRFLGKLVIVVPNEISNLTVGVANDVIFISKSDIPVLVVNDIVTGQERVVFSKVFAYTPDRFAALNLLSPEQRIDLVYNGQGYIKLKKEVPDTPLFTATEWEQIAHDAIARHNKKG